jgi:hypothetical protein
VAAELVRNPHRQTRSTTNTGRVFGLQPAAVRDAARKGVFDYVMVGSRMYILVPSIEQKLGGKPLIDVERELGLIDPPPPDPGRRDPRAARDVRPRAAARTTVEPVRRRPRTAAEPIAG